MSKLDKLLASESFLNYVLQKSDEDVAFWKQYIQDHPEQEETIERAALALLSLQFVRPSVETPYIETHWEQLQSRIRKEAFQEMPRKPFYAQIYFKLTFVSLVAVLLLVFYLTSIQTSHLVLSTGLDQQLVFTFQDDSEVVLEENTKIHFSETWSTDTVRRVWIDGKGKFSVTKSTNLDGTPKRFEVYTDQMLIEVIGTVFSVDTREEPSVILHSGHVDVQLIGSEQRYALSPGQKVHIDQQNKLQISSVLTKTPLSLTKGQVNLSNHSLREISAFIEQTFGIQVYCKDESLLERKVSGLMNVESLDDLIAALEIVFKIKIHKTNDKLMISTFQKTNKLK